MRRDTPQDEREVALDRREDKDGRQAEAGDQLFHAREPVADRGAATNARRPRIGERPVSRHDVVRELAAGAERLRRW